ncbi:hypothetical protein ACFXAZ_13340 [Streptomyces sp. NPDC059477]|uniref:hypothetical protein n=1 Tax=Streptomyces sp. NPDC059477 TaxID=3346847 RepID=UPI0036C1F8F4
MTSPANPETRAASAHPASRTHASTASVRRLSGLRRQRHSRIFRPGIAIDGLLLALSARRHPSSTA